MTAIFFCLGATQPVLGGQLSWRWDSRLFLFPKIPGKDRAERQALFLGGGC